MQKKNIKVGNKTGHNKIKKGKGKKENEMKHSNKIIRQKKTNKQTKEHINKSKFWLMRMCWKICPY